VPFALKLTVTVSRTAFTEILHFHFYNIIYALWLFVDFVK